MFCSCLLSHHFVSCCQQRVSEPRRARRLNHAFQHLYRHSDPRWDDDNWNDAEMITDRVRDFCDRMLAGTSLPIDEPEVEPRTPLLALQYLHLYGGYTLHEVSEMRAEFPPLLEMNVRRHLRPKMRFLKETLGGLSAGCTLDPALRAQLPASYFGARLERTVAPRHAFLVHLGLPSGKALWNGMHAASGSSRGGRGTELLIEFLQWHRKPQQFAALCNKWQALYGSNKTVTECPRITPEQIVAFDKLFQRGTLSAARNDSAHVYHDGGDSHSTKSTREPALPLLQTANVTAAQLIRYLLQHGANPWETDARGASLFHWAAGCGNLEGIC